MLAELLGGIPLTDVGLGGLVTLFILAILFGWLVPRRYVERAWGEKDALHGTLEAQGEQIATLASAMEDVKVSQQAILYAMQEIQAAGRYALEQRKATET